MTIKFFLLFFSIATAHICSAQQAVALKEQIKTLLAEQKLSGAVWATVSDSGDIHTDASGYKNTSTEILLNPTAKVQVGSVCKTIVAAGFLRMATLGLVKLDGAVKDYLPDLPLDNYLFKNDPVTIRHLLDHTSGLTDAKLWHIFSSTAKANTPLQTVYANSPGILKIQAKPGTMYSYSNIGYTILGMVIEKLTHQQYEDYLDEQILTPLNMNSSSFHFIAQTADTSLAYGHFDGGQPVTALPMYLRPAGQFTTTAADMGKFLRFMMSDGTIDGKPFIKNEFLHAVGRPTRTDAYQKGVPFGDALGAYSRDRYGAVGIAKNGNTLGFAAMIYFFPAHKKAFFIAFNMDSETANYDLFNAVLVAHLGVAKGNFVTKGKDIENELHNWNGYYIPVVTKVEPFGLLDIVFSHTRFSISKTDALLSPFQGKQKALIYQGSRLFTMADRTNVSHALYTNVTGQKFITDGVNTIQKISGFRVVAIAASMIAGITGMLYLLVVGFIQLVQYKLAFGKMPLNWVFVALLAFAGSIGLIATQPFMRLGDASTGNILLAISTLLVPMFSIVSLFLIIRTKRRYLQLVSFWALIFVLQFCAMLMANNLMPIIMWK